MRGVVPATAAARAGPQQAHEHRESEPGASLVCAYDSEEKFRQHHLEERAISREEFRSRVDSLPKGREVFFYCA
jgi:hypothetical protein